MDARQYADESILSFSINEDLTQKSISTFEFDDVPKMAILGDLVGVYDSKGKFIYWGVITKIEDKKVTTNQFISIYNDLIMITPQTTSAQQDLYENSSVSKITDFMLLTKELGYNSISTGTPTQEWYDYNSLRDEDVARLYRGIYHTIIDDGEERVPFNTEKGTKDLESFIYEQFNTYNRIARVNVNPSFTDKDIPSGYRRLLSITSNGHQYVDTGFRASETTQVVAEFEYTNSSSYQELFGCYGAMSLWQTQNKFYPEWHNDESVQITESSGYAYVNWNERSIDINDQSALLPYDTFRASGNFYIFAINDPQEHGWTYPKASMTLYELRLYDDGLLQHDYVPVLRLSDSKASLFDKVTQTYLENLGDQDFTFTEYQYGSLNLVLFNPIGQIEYEEGKSWNYNSIKLFNTDEDISNLSITKEIEDTNTCYIYNSDGTTLRGAYCVLNDGTLEQITGSPIANRVGANKTKYIFDDDNDVETLARANLPTLQYNHKITFDLNFDEYKISDFNLGMPIEFYNNEDKVTYSSILSAWKYSYSIGQNGILSANFTLGKVRNDLTSKLNLKKIGG